MCELGRKFAQGQLRKGAIYGECTNYWGLASPRLKNPPFLDDCCALSSRPASDGLNSWSNNIWPPAISKRPMAPSVRSSVSCSERGASHDHTHHRAGGQQARSLRQGGSLDVARNPAASPCPSRSDRGIVNARCRTSPRLGRLQRPFASWNPLAPVPLLTQPRFGPDCSTASRQEPII